MKNYLTLLSTTIFLAACGGGGEGTVMITAYGEEFIEQGIPKSETNDDWAVTFTKFEVNVADVVVGGVPITVTAPIELTLDSAGEGHLLGMATIDADDHTDSQYAITRVLVEGSATDGTDTKTFSWLFEERVEYTACETTTTVPADGSASFQVTVHADHLLYDSLVAEEPQVVFQALADADDNDDGEITQVELAAAGIGAYDPGNAPVDNLWDWLVAQTATLGHVDGEGHCDAMSI